MRKSNKKTNLDPNEIAFRVTQEATGQVKYSKAHLSQIMSHMGRLGGLKGGKARAESLSAEKRREIASNAAKTRWKNQK